MGNSSGIFFYYCKCICIWSRCRSSGSRYPEFRRLYIDRNRDALRELKSKCPWHQNFCGEKIKDTKLGRETKGLLTVGESSTYKKMIEVIGASKIAQKV